MFEIMEEDDVDVLNLPWTGARWDFYNTLDNDNNSIVDQGEFMEIIFEKNKQSKLSWKATTNCKQKRTSDCLPEMVEREKNPQKLECRFKSQMKEEGYRILWTPPYCPKLQPIEIFWGNGKNHVANTYDTNTTMKDVLRRLQDGWYGNENQLQPTDVEYTTGTTCEGLVRKEIKAGDKEYIPLSLEINERIGELIINHTHKRDTSKIPVDSFVVDITKDIILEEE